MSLYALRKKIQDDLAETENTISIIEPTTQINELHVAHGAKFITERILEWINKEIIEIESRVSQLEKEPAFCENCSLKCIASDCICDCHSRYRAARVSINELREVLGNEK